MANRGRVPRPEIVVDDEVDFDPMTGLQDLGSLWLNESVEGVYQALLSGPGRPPSSNSFEAVCLFRRYHDSEPDGAAFTALLLCTDRRWRGAAGRVIRDIDGLGVLDDEALDDLARKFVWAGDLWVDCRLVWLEPDVDPAQAGARVPVRREVRPAVRRWAAERRARRGGDTVPVLLDRARALGDLAGGAVAAGVVDAAGALDAAAREEALETGLAWSRAEVRRRALEVLAAVGRAEDACRRAAADPAKQVRRWGAKLEATLTAADEPSGAPTRGEAVLDPAGGEATQGSLFV